MVLDLRLLSKKLRFLLLRLELLHLLFVPRLLLNLVLRIKVLHDEGLFLLLWLLDLFLLGFFRRPVHLLKDLQLELQLEELLLQSLALRVLLVFGLLTRLSLKVHLLIDIIWVIIVLGHVIHIILLLGIQFRKLPDRGTTADI